MYSLFLYSLYHTTRMFPAGQKLQREIKGAKKSRSRGEVEGAERLVLIYACIDAFYLYRKFFAERKIAPFGILLEDYGFGCNYNRFGEGGLMAGCSREFGNHPGFMLCREESLAWQGYHRIPDLKPEYGGMHWYGRFLYER